MRTSHPWLAALLFRLRELGFPEDEIKRVYYERWRAARRADAVAP